MQTIEVSYIIFPVDSVVLSNQSNPSHQSVQSTVTSSPPHTQLGTLERSMADEMRLPIFRGDGSKDPDQHWFLCEAVWNIKRTHFSTTLRDHSLIWYMNLIKGIAQPNPLNVIKNALIVEFKKPNLESQCNT